MIAVAQHRAVFPSPTIDGETKPVVASRRFTLDGDLALEQHLELSCTRILSGIRGLIPARKLEALLLGGGYGRGEGGVLHTSEGDRPYNDLEFYVAIAGNRHVNEVRYRRRLHVLAEILTHLVGVEVEFKITSLAELRHAPVSMFSYDLVVGHRVIGKESAQPVLDGCDRHRCPKNIPVEEATRLLMNRCSGLLLARERLQQNPFSPAAADFVRRNIAKAQLAFGDAVLTAEGLYHWSCRERHARLKRLSQDEPGSWFDELLRYHAEGVAFKLHPSLDELSHETLVELHGQVTAFALTCWLRLESRRLQRSFASARAYALDPGDKGPRGTRLHNFLSTVRLDGRLRLRAKPWRHPRQRIFRALALLLWEPTTFSDPVLGHRLGVDLGASVATYERAFPKYREIWSRVA